MCIFSMLGAIMFVSKLVMEFLPNVHLIGALLMTYTIVYRWKALIPLYIFVFLTGLYGGFAPWWVPYLYVWTVLWGMTMLLPKKMKPMVAIPVYVAVCTLHGLLFGVLYAPFQALMFGLDWKGMIAWIVAGFPFDVTHAVGNFITAFLVFPLSRTLLKLEGRMGNRSFSEKTPKKEKNI